MRKLIATIAITAATMLGATACTADPEIVDTPPTTEQPAGDSAEVTEGDAPLPEDAYEEEAAPEVPTAKFGDSGYEYEDGLRIDITKGEEFTPTETAAFDEAPKYVRWDVTLTNGTDAPWDASMATVYVSSGGVEYGEVFDPEGGLNGAPLVPVMPGKSVTYTTGFGVADPADIVMNVSADFEHPAVLFTN